MCLNIPYTVRIIDENGKDLSGVFEITKNQQGFEILIGKIREYSSDNREVLIGIESERNAIVNYLLALGYKLYLVCPNMIKSLRKRYTGSGKISDELDSYVIADAVRTDRENLEPIKEKSEKIRRMELLMRQREAVVRDKVSLVNRITSFLKEYFPAFLEFFNDIGRPTALSFLQGFPTFEDVKELNKEDIRVFLEGQSYYSKKGIDKIWRAIQRRQINIDRV